MRVRVSLAVVAVLLAGCARGVAPVAVAPAPPAVVSTPKPRPVPPGGAATNVALPPELPDGSFATPNRALTPAATAWHLRAALNVAALRCNDGAVVADYNRFVTSHKAALARAHAAAMREAGGEAAFDARMTKLYNYFALPPVQASFCAAAATIAAEAAATPAAGFERLATLGLPVIDAPFTAFFAEYRDYRVALARWQAGQVAAASAPRLTYDLAVLTAEGPPRRIMLAAR
ncbi:hypothetical protein [Sphingomonas sp.]|uniref:hypothetical protein n=1 Tax=Sphingomonas sp. TaxID=28214 RepID=UPI002DD6B21F|nr:hypothetical protein [Sphingomonas sp.]